jgi:hypothetical protein
MIEVAEVQSDVEGIEISEEIMTSGISMEIGEPNGEGCDESEMSSDRSESTSVTCC